MITRFLIAATLCLASSAAVRAQDGATTETPLVLGDPGGDGTVGLPEAISSIQDDGSEAPGQEDPETSVLVGEPPASVADAPAVIDGSVVGTAPIDADVPVVADTAVETEWICDPSTCLEEADAWAAYTFVDALFLQRTNDVGPLAVTSGSASPAGAPVITAGDVRYPTFPGVRIFQGWRGPDGAGYEIGYLGVWGMYADAGAGSASGQLAVPGQLGSVAGSGFDAATVIRPALNSNLNSAELNWFATREYGGCRQHDPLPWRRSWDVLDGTVATADWILGVRWAGLDESAALAVTASASTPPPPLRTSVYRVTTASHLVGPQIGHRRRVDWGRWAVEGWAKAAVAASFLEQSQSPVVGPANLQQIRGPHTTRTAGVGMIGDLNATVIRRLDDRWSLRAGYTLLWLSGVAPAASQWDFMNTATSGTRLVAGTVFLHGATLGVEAAW